MPIKCSIAINLLHSAIVDIPVQAYKVYLQPPLNSCEEHFTDNASLFQAIKNLKNNNVPVLVHCQKSNGPDLQITSPYRLKNNDD